MTLLEAVQLRQTASSVRWVDTCQGLGAQTWVTVSCALSGNTRTLQGQPNALRVLRGRTLQLQAATLRAIALTVWLARTPQP